MLSCVYFPFWEGIVESRAARRSLNLMKVGTWMRSTPLVWFYYSWAERSCYYFKSILCLPVPVSSLLFRTYSNNAVSQNCIQSFKRIFLKATHGKEKESPIGNKTAAVVFFFFCGGIWPALLSFFVSPQPAVMQIVRRVQQWFLERTGLSNSWLWMSSGVGQRWESFFLSVFFLCLKAVVFISQLERVLQQCKIVKDIQTEKVRPLGTCGSFKAT